MYVCMYVCMYVYIYIYIYNACSAFNLRCQAQVCLERVRVTDPCTFSHAHTRALSTDPTQKFYTEIFTF